jgi:mannose-6-phosphate isomerase-like protein (cupin superfamily)
VAFRVLRSDELEWVERPPDADGPPRYVARLTEPAGFAHTRGNMWRFPPGAKGRRHRDLAQEETFVVLSGTLTMYLGDPPERLEVTAGGVVHVEAGTLLQSVNHGGDDLLVYAYGAPPEQGEVEFLESAV